MATTEQQTEESTQEQTQEQSGGEGNAESGDSGAADEMQDSSEEEMQEFEITMNDVSPMDMVKEMKIGWNLGNTLDSTSSSIGVNVEMAWGNPRTTQEMIDMVIDQGFNVIRIPVSWGGQMGGAPAYNILPAWMDRVQEVVDYAYRNRPPPYLRNLSAQLLPTSHIIVLPLSSSSCSPLFRITVAGNPATSMPHFPIPMLP